MHLANRLVLSLHTQLLKPSPSNFMNEPQKKKKKKKSLYHEDNFKHEIFL